MSKLSTDPYKGTRDFYPEDMAVQSYIFETWSRAAELFGFERYDASILEPSELYKSKGAENEEIINEQTYTFVDRGEREVTLRPEMTPTVARMVAARRRELSFPVRWYSIPNLFRYERPQRGRVREHWQLNCDIFGADDAAADIEIIALAHSTLTAFGATPDMFEIRVNDRAWLTEFLRNEGLDGEKIKEMLALLDRKEKIDDFEDQMLQITEKHIKFPESAPSGSRLEEVVRGLEKLGITNVHFSNSTVRGFNYYTGTIFEFFDTDKENSRSLLGGGRYDNLTALFGGEAISGVGFGMGDVTMRDFLETHNLLTADITAPTIMILPTEPNYNLDGELIAKEFRAAGISTAVDFSSRKLGKKLSSAGDAFVTYALVIGEDELKAQRYTLKNLTEGSEHSGTLSELVSSFT